MVGEVYLLDPDRVVTYYGTGHDELPLAFNFSFLWSPWDAAAFRAQVDRIEALLPPGAQPTYVLSSHDAPRHRSRFDHPRWGDARARVAALMLLALHGTPFLYYGEEIGMRDVVVPLARVQDPVGKRFPALNRDPERTPMQWQPGPGAGFTTANHSWLPVGPNTDTVNVVRQTDDADSLLSFYRRVIWYRKRSPALRRGSYRPVDASPDTFVFVRECADERLAVALNFASEPRAVDLAQQGGTQVLLSTDDNRPTAPIGPQPLRLGPLEGVIVRC